jgi:hypothetical protein
MKSFYQLLGASEDDDAEPLKKAFRNAVKAHHPDLRTERKLLKDNPWTRDIIRVLWDVDTCMRIDTLAGRLRELREACGLPMPIKFEETVQSILYLHTSQSVEWKKSGAKPADDLFYSPKGKGSGTWALRNRERALQWLKARNLNKD